MSPLRRLLAAAAATQPASGPRAWCSRSRPMPRTNPGATAPTTRYASSSSASRSTASWTTSEPSRRSPTTTAAPARRARLATTRRPTTSSRTPGARRLRRHPAGVRVPRLRRPRRLRAGADRADPDDVRRGHRLRRHAALRARRRVTAAVTPGRPRAGPRQRVDTSGCEAADFAGFPAGNIALIQRGTCTFEHKGNNAAAAGAVGDHLLQPGQHRRPRAAQGIPAVTLGNGYTGGIPAVNATYAPRRGVRAARPG